MSESIWNDPRITEYVMDEMSVDVRSDFETEIDSNPELSKAVAEARQVTDQLAGLYASEPQPPLDAGRREAILAGGDIAGNSGDATPVMLATDEAARNVPNWLRRHGLTAAIAAISACVLFVVAVPPLQRSVETAMTIEPQTTDSAEADFEADEPEVAAEAVSQLADADPLSKSSGSEQVRDEVKQDVSGAMITPPGVAIQEEVLSAELSSVADVRGSIMIAPTEAPAPAAADPATITSAVAEPSSRAMSRSLGNQLSMTPPQPRSSNAPATPGMNTAAAPTPATVSPSFFGGKSSAAAPAAAATIETAPSRRRRARNAPMLNMEMSESMGMEMGMEMEMEMVPEAKLSSDAGVTLSKQPSGWTRPIDAVQDFEATAVADPAATADYTVLSQTGRTLGVSSGQERFKGQSLTPRMQNFGEAKTEGIGPEKSGDRFDPITENAFKRVSEHPLSTLSVDVDTASYSKVRDILVRANQLPRPDMVRIEEFVNYFDYDYEGPNADSDHPFASRVEIARCPWNSEHRLARIALKGKEMATEDRPRSNLVFLLDTSGSMNAPNKLPLVQSGMKMLLKQLNDTDRVAIVVYAGSAGLVLDSTSVKKKKDIKRALTQLSSGGSTNGGQGIALAYQTARDNFIKDGVNRVILCTDGDFNVGTTSTDALVKMVENEAKGGVFLSVMGFGMGNHNDAMLEQISGRGNGNYAFIDSENEARKVFVQQTNATLVTIAKDVKLQIEFNVNKVSSYRLIGYENRVLAKEDFKNDKVDAGEIGAGHAVTALYEIVPAGIEPDAGRPEVDDLKYQTPLTPTEAANSDELMTLKLRYKQPDSDTGIDVEIPVTDKTAKFKETSDDFRFATAVVGFGMQLRRSQYAGSWTLSDVLRVAEKAVGDDRYEQRAEFITLVKKASSLMGQE